MCVCVLQYLNNTHSIRFGYEQAFPVRKGNDTWSVEERVRITHVLLQLLNSKLVPPFIFSFVQDFPITHTYIM